MSWAGYGSIFVLADGQRTAAKRNRMSGPDIRSRRHGGNMSGQGDEDSG
jgi:hypothetical protein